MIAKFLYPDIITNSIQLKDPVLPLNKLPVFSLPLAGSQVQKSAFKASSRNSSRSSSLPTAAYRAQTYSAKQNTIKYTVVCVDDSPVILSKIESSLGKNNFNIVKFSESSKAAFQIRKLNADIIFLDINMPKMNGYDLCRMLKSHPSTKNIPVIMLTGSQSVMDRSRAKSAGASDFVTKPFTRSELLETIAKCLRSKNGQKACL
ncbi:MAG: response regulator [Phormidesmis sp.]